MKNPPTDRKLLQSIYNRYYNIYSSANKNENNIHANYLPIDCHAIAKDLKINENIVFGQLYYHLDKKYRYTQEDGSKVHLFSKVVGDDKNAINFPLMCAVLAELHEEHFRAMLPIVISIFALVISFYALQHNS